MARTSFAALAALAAIAGHQLRHPHAHATAEPCRTTAAAPFALTTTGTAGSFRAYQTGGGIDCGRHDFRLYVRICPEQLVGGSWQLIPGGGGWTGYTGTCHDSGWIATTALSMTWQYLRAPGTAYRTLVQSWTNIGGRITTAAAVSGQLDG